MHDDLDEWRMAVNDMSETDRLATAIDMRTSAGLSAADAEDDDPR